MALVHVLTPFRLLVSTLLVLGTALVATPALAFDNVTQGAFLDASAGTSSVGDFVLGEIGAESTGIATLSEQRYLLQWDVLFAPRAGVLAASIPYTPLYGGRARLMAEGGNRFASEKAHSFYLGLRASGDGQLLIPSGKGLGGLATVNNIDGIGDLSLTGAVRLAGGWSFLRDHHALLVTAYVEELGRGAETNAPGEAFTNFGLAARYDLAHKLTLTGDLAWGRAPSLANSSLHSLEFHELISMNVLARKIFANGMWLGFSWGVTIEQESTTYTSGPTYSTTDAPTVTATVFFGIPFGAQAFP